MVMFKSTPQAYELLHEGQKVLAQIENNGVRVDKEYLDKTMSENEDRIADLEEKMRKDKELYPIWRKMYGERMNLGSRKQLARALNKMGYKLPKTDKEAEDLNREWGSKIDKSVLEEIGADVKFLSYFQETEQLKKVQSTYLHGIKREMVEHHKGDWRVHPSYNLNTVATYRSSCDKPNFQNIPVRNARLAELVRRCYIPLDGCYFVEVDFGQLEVRIAYTYHKDPTMGAYLHDPKSDMHKDWAAKVYCLDREQVSKNARYAAKNMWVFPQFYGSVHFQCAPSLWEAIDQLPGMSVLQGDDDPKEPSGINLKRWLKKKGIKELGNCNPEHIRHHGTEKGTFVHHLKELENVLWKEMFPVYDKWKKEWYDDYQKNAGFQMLTGFAVNGYHKRNDVINYPVQGAAFHCLLWCLIRIQKWLNKYRMKTMIVGEIHDSLQAVVPANELQDFLTFCHWCMTVALPRAWKWINCPIETESEVSPRGESWHAKKVWTQQKGGIWAVKP
jgi:DNA polymerase I-like protein with 3'-5' exonuclease and polymerase domains